MDDEDDHIDEASDDGEDEGGEEGHKEAVVPPSDAVAEKGAVVIEDLDAVLASRAVGGADGPEDVAGLAEFEAGAGWLREVLLESVSVEREERPARNDAWIAAASHDQEYLHQRQQTEEEGRQHRRHLRVTVHHQDGERDYQSRHADLYAN